jgi:hypothetical protein
MYPQLWKEVKLLLLQHDLVIKALMRFNDLTKLRNLLEICEKEYLRLVLISIELGFIS